MHFVSNQGKGSSFAQIPILPRRKQAPNRVSLVPIILLRVIGVAGSNCISQQQNPELLKCHSLQFLEVFEDYLSMQNTTSVHLENLTSLTLSMINMGDY